MNRTPILLSLALCATLASCGGKDATGSTSAATAVSTAATTVATTAATTTTAAPTTTAAATTTTTATTATTTVATTADATSPTTSANDPALARYLITADDLQGFVKVDDDEGDSGDDAPETADPAACSLFADSDSKAAASADVTLANTSGAALSHQIERYGSADEAKAFMAQLKTVGAQCGSFTLTGSAGARPVTITTTPAATMGDEGWAATVSGLIPDTDTMVALAAVRKGAYVSSLFIFPVEANEAVPEELIQLALSKLP